MVDTLTRHEVTVGLVGDTSSLDPRLLAETQSAFRGLTEYLNQDHSEIFRQFCEGRLSKHGFDWYEDTES